jgi:hypothetical protein
VLFAPNPQKAADEMLRVCRRGGKIGLANWIPRGFIGQLFKTIGSHLPPPFGVQSPALWGTTSHLNELFEARGNVTTQTRNYVFRYRSPQHWMEVFRGCYGPVLKAFEALDAVKGAALERDIAALLDRFNVAEDGTLVAPSEYLEVVITKKR